MKGVLNCGTEWIGECSCTVTLPTPDPSHAPLASGVRSWLAAPIDLILVLYRCSRTLCLFLSISISTTLF